MVSKKAKKLIIIGASLAILVGVAMYATGALTQEQEYPPFIPQEGGLVGDGYLGEQEQFPQFQILTTNPLGGNGQDGNKTGSYSDENAAGSIETTYYEQPKLFGFNLPFLVGTGGQPTTFIPPQLQSIINNMFPQGGFTPSGLKIDVLNSFIKPDVDPRLIAEGNVITPGYTYTTPGGVTGYESPRVFAPIEPISSQELLSQARTEQKTSEPYVDKSGDFWSPLKGIIGAIPVIGKPITSIFPPLTKQEVVYNMMGAVSTRQANTLTAYSQDKITVNKENEKKPITIFSASA